MKAENLHREKIRVILKLTDKEAIRKNLDEFQLEHGGRVMTHQEFLDAYMKGQPALYNSIGQELEQEGRLEPEQPIEVREEIFGKPPEEFRTIQVKEYTRTIHYYAKEGGYVSKQVHVKGYSRRVRA
jgi:hypothetical protein